VLDAARAADCESVVFLEYTLTPACRYPGQLVQAATAVNAVMKKEGIGAEQILLGGDSAGGNLALGVLAHVIKPHPDVPVIASGEGRGEERFKGVFLLSPWQVQPFTYLLLWERTIELTAWKGIEFIHRTELRREREQRLHLRLPHEHVHRLLGSSRRNLCRTSV
jgi:hypothetical protein